MNASKIVFKPGYYGKKRRSAADWVDLTIKKWKEEGSKEPESVEEQSFPHICIARQIGSGALEVADRLSEILPYQVADREILEYMVKDTRQNQAVLEFYDERYPGKMSELFSMLISDKTFLKSDYARQLVKTVTTLAQTGPTIFVGRGAHLILPRHRILSVKLISDMKNRAARLAGLMKIGVLEAEKQLKTMDDEQKQFFKSVYNGKGLADQEFDLILNRDYFREAAGIARILAAALEEKFGRTENL